MSIRNRADSRICEHLRETHADPPERTGPAVEASPIRCATARVTRPDPFLDKPQRFAMPFIAVFLALSLALIPSTALATTGTTATQDVGMVYYFGTDGSHGLHNLLKLGSDWVYCMNATSHFKAGVTLTGVDAVKAGKLSQKCVTDLALAYRYVWDEDLYRTPSGKKLTKNIERYAAAQVLMWTILTQYYPDKGWPKHNRITIDGAEVTGDGKTSGNNKDAYDWIEENRSRYIGHCEFFEGNTNQDFAFKFESELQVGKIALTKQSANPGITDNNRCYSLGNAKYGIYSDGSCTKLAATLVSDSAGKATSPEIPVGTYYAKEITAPEGYALSTTVYTVEVQAGKTTQVNASKGFVPEAPQANKIDLWVAKEDAETADGGAQGSATLAGAQFTIDYYDGYYNAESLPGAPKRTWVVETDDAGHAVASDELKVDGDEFYVTSSGEIAVPLGTVVVRETKAPQGYHLGNGVDDEGLVDIVRVTANGTTSANLQAYVVPIIPDFVKRGGVMVGKVDRENGEYLPQGSATLQGALIEIVTNNDQQVVVDGNTYLNGSVVKTIQTQKDEDGRFIAMTDDNCLPVGTYTLREAGTSPGYLLDGESLAWRQTFEITDQGEVVDLTGLKSAVSNPVIRGDFELSKVDGQTARRLARVPFMITSQTTGERHVLVTDENGMASTCADWNSHKLNTNANDDAVTEGDDGALQVDDEALDPLAGIWFDGRTDAACDPDDERGALPFDTYTIEELRCAANEGYELVTFETVISRNNRELDLGTVDDNAGPVIGTSLSDEHGAKIVPADSTVIVTDTVSYANLDVRQTYSLEGELHLVGEDGNDEGVVATSSAEFSPEASSGTANIDFAVDTGGVAGKKLVAFETLYDAEGNEVADHEDLSDEGQTVRVPGLETHLSDQPEQGSPASAAGPTTLVDTVTYTGLAPGRAYTVTGTLHVRDADGNDAGAAHDADGNEITASQTFVAGAPDGSVDIVFTFTAPALAGKTVVAFEDLSVDGVSYAVHADITDESQTVYIPGIETSLRNKVGTQEVKEGEAVELIDTVAYCNLVPGARYTLTGTFHVVGADGADEGELRDASGTACTAKTVFTPEAASGTVDVDFSVDTSDLGGKSLVCFESLTNEDGALVAVHEDIASAPQTVTVKETEKKKEKKNPPVEKTKASSPAKTESTGTVPTKGKSIVKTGDNLPILGLMLVPLGIAALGLAALSVKRLRRGAHVRIDRGPNRM